MSILTEINRLKTLRDAIRAKLVSFGLATDTAKLEDCKTALEAVVNRGAVSQTLTTNNQTYTVPDGYHNGSGAVKTKITNLTAGNIKKGVNVGGEVGTYEGAVLYSGTLTYSISTFNDLAIFDQTGRIVFNQGSTSRKVSGTVKFTGNMLYVNNGLNTELANHTLTGLVNLNSGIDYVSLLRVTSNTPSITR